MDSPKGVRASVHVSGDRTGDRADEIIRAKDTVTVVIFGASGDLSKRKLIPALYHLGETGYLPDRYAVIGFSRTEMSDEAYRENTLASLREQVEEGATRVRADNPLITALHYQPGNNNDPKSFKRLREKLETLERERDLPGNRLFYLSVAPEFFTTIIQNLCSSGLICGTQDEIWSRGSV